MKQQRIFTRDFILVFIAAGLIRICYQIQNTVTPLYVQNLGFSTSSIGLLVTVVTIASLALRPFLGGWLDRYGRKGIALVGTAIFTVATLWNGLAASIVVLIVIKALQGVGFSAHTTSINTMATDVLPEERMSEGIGYMGLTGSVSLAVAPAIALSLVGGGQFGTAYNVAFAAGILSLLCIGMYKGKPKAAAANVSQVKVQGIARFFEPAAFKPSAVMLLLGLCAAAPVTFLSIFTLGRGFTTDQVSLYFTINAVALAVARLFGARVARKISVNRAVLLATVCNAAAFILIAISQTIWMLWPAAALYGLGYGTIYPMLNGLAITNSPPNRRGTAMATFLTAMDIGIGLGASFWGVLADLTSINIIFPLCAGLSLLAYVLFRILNIKMKKELPS
ncbi:MAG TPA: MFS transporter [Candidatus Limiplasma sp.]|nr:MFS transporter [Candidatus Limiplasma sp.]HRX09590.1 MFS transporter [Candidatus Limiplasma sp.]